MIRERTDWCISRQRRWGLPIPVFYCKDCGKPICTDGDHRRRLQPVRGEGLQRLVRDGRPRRSCRRASPAPTAARQPALNKESDTLDGWFDSGSTHFASMERDQGFWPATMYLEGLDQYRGWFQSSLLTAVGALGQWRTLQGVRHPRLDRGRSRAGPCTSPWATAWIPAEIFNKYGADLLRLWAGSADYHVDVRCSDEIFKQLSLRTI